MVAPGIHSLALRARIGVMTTEYRSMIIAASPAAAS
jgi:hypothetical protein